MKASIVGHANRVRDGHDDRQTQRAADAGADIRGRTAASGHADAEHRVGGGEAAVRHRHGRPRWTRHGGHLGRRRRRVVVVYRLYRCAVARCGRVRAAASDRPGGPGDVWTKLLPESAYRFTDDNPAEAKPSPGRTFPHSLQSPNGPDDPAFVTTWQRSPWADAFVTDFAIHLRHCVVWPRAGHGHAGAEPGIAGRVRSSRSGRTAMNTGCARARRSEHRAAVRRADIA